MKKFNAELLEQKSGRLDAVIFKNSHLKIPDTLFYTIQVELKDFSFQNDLIETAVILNFIRLDIHRIKELENQVFEFPINPIEGYIDGSIYLFDVHNPFDVKKIDFKNWDNGSIDAIIHFDIDFEYENTGYEKITNCKLKVSLERGSLSIGQDILPTENFNPGKAKEIISKFVSPKDYGEPAIVDGQVIFEMQPD